MNWVLVLTAGVTLLTNPALAESPALQCEESNIASGKLIAEVGRLHATDDMQNFVYDFVACHVYDVYPQHGEVLIHSSRFPDATFDSAALTQGFAAVPKKPADGCVQIGAAYTPANKNDKRRVSYFACGGAKIKPRLELRAVLLGKKSKPKSMQKMVIAWPQVDQKPAHPLLPAHPPPSAVRQNPINCGRDAEELGRFSSPVDELSHTIYNFVLCREHGETLKLSSNYLASGSVADRDVDAMPAGACTADIVGYKPEGPGDQRKIVYRFCHKPNHIEIEVHVVAPDFTAKPAETGRIGF